MTMSKQTWIKVVGFIAIATGSAMVGSVDVLSKAESKKEEK